MISVPIVTDDIARAMISASQMIYASRMERQGIMKIQIIGYSGSGKSTLAKKLGEFYGIPYLHLDNVHFYGDWQERSNEEQSRIVRTFLEENQSWVIDGNYSVIAPERFEASDLTVFLDYNRFFCLRMCIKRYRQHKKTSRESCPCKEKFDGEFFKWIMYESRTKNYRQKHRINLSKTKGKRLIFKNRKQLGGWLREIGVERN